MRVLLIEDDAALGAAVREQLIEDGCSVDWARRIEAARDHLGLAPYQLILLDLMLPDGRGLDLLRDLRARGDASPVIILTALDQISDRIAGLNAGADDYLVKPFDLSELTARVGAVSRRYRRDPNPVLKFGELTVDLSARRVTRGEASIALTAREWTLFETFVRHPGAILSRRQLEDQLYSFEQEVEPNTIEANVSRLRKKLGPDMIETVRGLGYRFAAESARR